MFNRSPIAKKLTILIIAFSTAITILTTGTQLIFDYREELGDIYSQLEEIKIIQVSPLSHSMWTFDSRGIQIIIDNILKIQDIELIEVTIDEKHSWSGGERVSRKIIDTLTPIHYQDDQERLEIGTLRMVASLDKVYDRLIQKTAVIFIGNGFKTFFVSLFILFLFQRLVTRHLTDLGEYAGKVASGTTRLPFKLNRQARSNGKTDELEKATSAINLMREKLQDEIEKIKQTEETLILTRVSVEVASDSLYWILPDARIVDVNEAACRSLGYPRKELLQLSMFNLDPNYTPEVWQKHFQDLRSQRTLRFESSHCRKDGTIFPVEIVANYVCHNSEERNCVIVRDITERKLAEAENAKLEAQLQHSQKMEAIGTLAGGIAHDFNNILGVIIGYAEMAREDSPQSSKVIKCLDYVLHAAIRAKNLVQQILAFSRSGEAERTALQPAPVVKEAIEMLRPALPTTIEIDQQISSQTGCILADHTQLHQIVINLGTNAFHAMEETGGKLGVSLKATHLTSEELLNEPGVEAGTFVELSISDSGPGIIPEIKDKIFDPFFTTKQTGKGTGMGLSIIHGIVKSYGGIISVDSEPGQGASFNVYLPVIDSSTKPLADSVDQIPRGKERILLIDDEESLTQLGKELLEGLGYTVAVSNNSCEALESFTKKPDEYDLVLTDQTMPGMTGSDLAKRMLEIRPGFPIILCTGYSSIISEEQAKSIGIKEFALKPLTKEHLAKLVRNALDN